MVRKKAGRRKGRRTKGFFFRPKRGWFTVQDGKFVPLLDIGGLRIREQLTPEAQLKDALARLRVQKPQVIVPANDAQVGQVCAEYLDSLRPADEAALVNPSGTAKTYIDRGQTLFDFCYGLPGAYFCKGDKKKRAALIEEEAPKNIHSGFGAKLCSEIMPGDVDAWLKAHKWKEGGRRTRVQALKRAFNFAVERKLITKNPIRGYKVGKSGTRITYFTPDQELAMIEAASPAFAKALKVCIRTGARFGCEFAALRWRHVKDHGDRMEWYFKPEESKTGRQTNRPRIIRVTDPEIIKLVREGCKEGRIFRNETGEHWTRGMLSQNFRRVRTKIKKKGILLDEDACMYSCRHTYAKRCLEGYWTGKPVSINTLARLMGNSVKVCIENYLRFSEADTEMLWESA